MGCYIVNLDKSHKKGNLIGESSCIIGSFNFENIMFRPKKEGKKKK